MQLARKFKKLKRLWQRKWFHADYVADGLAIRRKNTGWRDHEAFANAYAWSAGYECNGQRNPWISEDLRWRAHLCCWAAQHGLQLDGAFVECGVAHAVGTGTVCQFLDFANTNRSFYLFDTFAGTPIVDGMTQTELAIRHELLRGGDYFDCYDYVTAKFRDFPNVHLMRGLLPEALAAIDGQRIAYLSIDLNNAVSERGVIQRLWDQLVPGAAVVIDDYAFERHEAQFEMWNDFASSRGLTVFAVPTGQGLLVKP